MKRIIFFLTLLLTVSLAAVQAKTLVVYYSYTGNCEAIANALSNQITADVLEIEPAEKGLRYEANRSALPLSSSKNYALGTQLLNAIKANPNDAASYPAIDPVSISLSDYQNIIIVTPLWWSQMAALMQTFLFNYGTQMAGKNIGLIVSSASSGISGVDYVDLYIYHIWDYKTPADGDFRHVSPCRTYTSQSHNFIIQCQPQMDGIQVITVQILIDAVLRRAKRAELERCSTTNTSLRTLRSSYSSSVVSCWNDFLCNTSSCPVLICTRCTKHFLATTCLSAVAVQRDSQ